MIRPGKSVGHYACESESSQVSEAKLPGTIRLFRAAMAHPRCKSFQTRRGAPWPPRFPSLRPAVLFTVGVRAPESEPTGTAGANEVSANFERINWGPVPNPSHDLGTDLFVMARDARRFDLGVVVGVQVKAGGSYFREPVLGEAGVEEGWWFRDPSGAHVDAWLSHALPHLIVLHNMDSRTSYWVHVTQESVQRTGAGAKILVPRQNTIDVAHQDALLRVAATARAGIPLEGSAWAGAQSLLPKDVLRHALVVPRLVAPHPNAGLDKPVTAEQAVALLLEGHVARLGHFAHKHPGVPTLAEANASPDWAWRFAGALGDRLLSGGIDTLRRVADDKAATLAQRVAATVALAAGLVDRGEADEAIARLEAELARDKAEPVDHAWLRLQHARACAETGRIADAREDAAFVQRLRITSPDDVTATAIAGVAAMVVFNASPWADRDVESVIRGADTAAAWWRTQTVSWALSAFADQTFEDWAHDTSVTYGRDPVDEQLLPAALTASYLGDHGAWRQAQSLLGRHHLVRLDRNCDPEEGRIGLDLLRQAGDEATLKRAVLRIAADGPASAITLAAADIQLDKATRTTAPADLAFLRYGGDLLDCATAERTVAWLLAALDDPATFATRTSPSYDVRLRLIDTLAGVVPAAPPAARDAVINLMTTLPAHEVACAWSPCRKTHGPRARQCGCWRGAAATTGRCSTWRGPSPHPMIPGPGRACCRKSDRVGGGGHSPHSAMSATCRKTSPQA